MLRRVFLGLLVLLLIVVAGLGLLLLERRAALQALIENRLAALGLSDIALEVRELEWSRTVLAGIAAGEGLGVRQVVINHDLGELLALRPPRIDAIDIDGLVLDVGALHDGPVARLRAGLSDGGTDAETSASLPLPVGLIRLNQARVALPTPWGQATLTLDATAGPVEPDAIPVAAEILATSRFGELAVELQGTAALTGEASGEITLASERFIMADLTAIDIAGRIDAALSRDGLPSLDGVVSVAALNLGDIEVGAGRLAAQFIDAVGSAELTLTSPHHEAGLRLSAERTDDPLRPRMTIALNAEVAASSTLLSLAGPYAPRQGRAVLSVVADGRLNVADPPAPAPAAVVRELAAGSWRASIAADLRDVAHGGLVSGLSATAGIDLQAVDDAVTVILPAPILLDVADVDAAAWRDAGLPPDLARQFAGPLAASIGARHADPAQGRIDIAGNRASFSAVASVWSDGAAPASISSALDGVLRLQPSPGLERLVFDRLDAELRDLSAADQRFSRVQLSGSGSAADDRLAAGGLLALAMASAAVGDVVASDIAAELPFDVELTPTSLLARPTAPARLDVGALALADTLRLQQPLALALTPRGDTALVLPLDGTGAPRIRHDLTLTSNDLAFRVAAGDTGATVRMAPLTIAAVGTFSEAAGHRGRIRVATPRLDIPEHDLTASGLDADLRTGTRIEAAVQIARLSHPAAPPLALAGDAVLADEVITFALRPRTIDTGIEVMVRGSHDLAAGDGRARVDVPAVVFSPDALQPRALTVALSDLTDVAGTVDASAVIDWNAAGVDGTAELRAADLSFVAAGVSIAGLSTTLSFSRLLPPVSRPAQLLTIRTIDAGVPLRDLTARLGFALDEAGGARLDLPEAAVAFAGGRMTLRDARLDTRQPENRLTLELEQLDLGELLALVRLDGLSGTGVLNGSLPIAVRDGRVAIADGALRTTGGGVLRYRSPTARQALESGGESVDLLLQALENFQYDALSFAVDKRLDGETELRLQTTGSNPEVLDGYPFAININLSGNADRILASVLEGFRLSDTALRAIVR